MIKSYAGKSIYVRAGVAEEEFSSKYEKSIKSLATLLDELQSDIDGIAEEDNFREQLEDFGTVKLPLARRVYAKLVKNENKTSN